MASGGPASGGPASGGPASGRSASGETPRFLSLSDVAEILSVSINQAYALVRRGDLRAIKIGGRGQWRVESTELERFIRDAYKSTEEYIRQHPFVGDETPTRDTRLLD